MRTDATVPSTELSRRLGYAILAAASVLLLSVFASSAGADSTFCSQGSEAGQCDEPQGIAVDRSNGNVYVANKGNSRIDVFDSSGSFLYAFGWGVADGTTTALQACTSTCFKGISGSGAGQVSGGELALAIDNDSTSPSYRDLYVGERDGRRVQKFGPAGEFILMLGDGVNKTKATDICTAESGDTCGAGAAGRGPGEFNRLIRPALGPAGALYVADAGQNGEPTRVQRFTPLGGFIGQALLLGTEQSSALAVDSAGDLFIGEDGSIRKYDQSGSLIETRPAPEPAALGIDASDNLFAADRDGESHHFVTKYDPSGAILSRFGYSSIEERLPGIAPFHTAEGEIYATEEGRDRIRRLSLPPPGPFPCCQKIVPGNTKAILKGEVNPEGKATTYHFEYLTDTQFKAAGDSFGAGTIKTPESAPVGLDFSLHPAEAQVGCATPQTPPQESCLEPATVYHYRLVAKNADGENSVSGEFETLPPVEVTQAFATEVGPDASLIHAVVNPLGIPASGYFEYVDDLAYEADKGEGGDGFGAAAKVPDVDDGGSPIDLGSGSAEKEAAVQLTSLTPGATYHFRIVVTNSFLTEAGPERTFTTFPLGTTPTNSCPNDVFRSGPSAALPDCRAYEMVSPVDKNGGDIKVLGGNKDYLTRLEQSSADGNRFAYSSNSAFAGAKSAPWTSQYIARRTEVGWATEPISPPRESVSLTPNPFAKFDNQFKAFSSDLSSGWLIHDTEPSLDPCGSPGFVNLYRRDNATGAYEALTTAKPENVVLENYVPELQGVSPDGTRAIFRANAKLTPKASGAANRPYQIYEHIKGEEGGCGELRLVSVLPNGNATTFDSSVGAAENIPGLPYVNLVGRATSADGSRIYWSISEPLAAGTGPVYLRVNAEQEQSKVGGGKCTEVGKACTVKVSAANGQFWTAATDGSKAIYSEGGNFTTEGGNLFKFDAAKAIAGEQASTQIGTGVLGVVAASEDVSRVYFVSNEKLGGEGEVGKPNLYLREGGVTKLIATLYGGNATLKYGDLNTGFPSFGFAVGRPEPIANGVRASADGSTLAFVSAENLTGYDNTDAATGRPALELYRYDATTSKLACISCNPSGARPAGRELHSNIGPESLMVSAQMAPGENQLFAPRALSADGNRLFFESYEALLARDTNGRMDVYGWQRAAGQKECDENGAELYVPSAGGCLSLISTGQSPVDSELADASPDGHDVFIRTSSSLLPQDPGQVDLYDARIGGGMPQPPAPPAACEGEACQGPLAPPNDPTPASSAFEGAGNVAAAPASCRKPKVRRRGRCVPRTSHGKQQKQHRRASDGRRAGR